MMCRDKVALVTGAAVGIGRAAAVLFAREGAAVVLADRDEAQGLSALEEIRAAGGQAIFITTDVSVEAEVAALVARAISEFGHLDMALNNAGITGIYEPVDQVTEDNWERVAGVNMNGIRYCMRHEALHMAERGKGAIVNTCSVSGLFASPNYFPYISTKHAVTGMTKSAALDLGPKNIRVNALMPGFTDTPMLQAGLKGGTGMAAKGGLEERIPLRRLGQPEEQAEAAVWMCSDRASYLNGHLMVVDGGMSIKL